MPIIFVSMQVLTGRRDRFVPQIVSRVSQVNLPVHHVRACSVTQPMGRRLAQPLGCTLMRFACRLQMSDRVVEQACKPVS
jgi:hypothetical protein